MGDLIELRQCMRKKGIKRDKEGSGRKNVDHNEVLKLSEKINRFFAKHWLTRKLFILIYRCDKCGKPLKTFNLKDLPVDIQAKHINAGTAWAFNGFMYACPDLCQGADVVNMIM